MMKSILHKRSITIIAVFALIGLLLLTVILANNVSFYSIDPTENADPEIVYLDEEAAGGSFLQFTDSIADPDKPQYRAYFSTRLSEGWDLETSDRRESIEITEGLAGALCTVGGYEAGTHYARIRRKLPERDGIVVSQPFTFRSQFEIPEDFYDNQEAFMRFMTTDNFGTTLDGEQVGAKDDQEWRIGLLIFGSDQLLRLQSLHEGNGENHITLWKADERLEPGEYNFEIDFNPSKTDGSWELRRNDIVIAGESGVPTVPSSVDDDEIEITRIGGCIDGASDQDSKQASIRTYEIEFIVP